MADNTVGSASSASDPYSVQSYTASSNSKNTITTEGYFKLLAAELANQDMSNPMDTSELMNQMTQMTMIQTINTLNANSTKQIALSKTSYMAGLIGKDVSAKLSTEDILKLKGADNGIRYGKVISVDLTGDDPTFRIEGSSYDFPLDNMLAVGKDLRSQKTEDQNGDAADSGKEG